MWFVFGFISLIGFVAYSVHQRTTAKWKGTQSYARRKLYEYEVLVRRTDSDSDATPIGLRMGVTAPTRFDFSLKPEKWRDWFSKRIGFSVEHHRRSTNCLYPFERCADSCHAQQQSGVTE